MSETKPLNKPLVVFTLVVTVLGGADSHFAAPRHYSETTAFIIGLAVLALSPILITWFQALWNALVPRITGWQEISFWEAAGLSALVFFMS